MNSRRLVGKLLLLTLLSGLFPLLSGCGNRKDMDRLEVEIKEITDSIGSGNLAWVDSVVELREKESLSRGDSMAWAAYHLRRGVAAFYSGHIHEALKTSDDVFAFLGDRPQTDEGRPIVKMASRIKGAFYQQANFNPDSCIHYQKIALDNTDPDDLSEYILAVANLADAYKLASRYATAADLYQRAILHTDSVGIEPRAQEPLMSGLAGTYTAMGDYEEAAEWWDKTMVHYPTMEPYVRFTNLNNLGNYYYTSGDYPKALETFDRLENLLDSVGASAWEKNFCDANRADVYLRLGNTDSAKVIIDRVLPFFEREEPSSTVVSHIQNLQMVYYSSRGNYARVEELSEAHPVRDTLRNEQMERRLEVLKDYYTHTGQWREAYRTAEHLNALRDSLVSFRVRQTLAYQKLAYQRDSSILSLRADNALKEARIYRLGTILGLSVLAIAVLILGMILYRRSTRRHEERMWKKIVSMRMDGIRGRITPHFIYNVLNNELLLRQQGAEGHLEAVIRLLRRQQFIADRIVDSLSEELEFMSDYVEVQGARLDSPVELKVDTGGVDTASYGVPSMILQILAENAFKHSFPTLVPGEVRRIAVSVRPVAGEGIEIRFENNRGGNTPSGGEIYPAAGSGNLPRQGGLGLRIIYETINYFNHKFRTDITFTTGGEGKGLWVACLQVPTRVSPEQSE